MNIANILKNVDKGTVLYSPLFGKVIFNGIFENKYPILVYGDNGNLECFTAEGKYYDHKNGECMLFPSKDQRDWSKFEVVYKDGDILSTEDGRPFIFKKFNEKGYSVAYGGVDNMDRFIKNESEVFRWSDEPFRKASPEEENLLFDKMSEVGFIWDRKNTIVKRDLLVDTIVIVSNDHEPKIEDVQIRRYAGNHTCYIDCGTSTWKIIVPLRKFHLCKDGTIKFNNEDNYGIDNDE